MVSAKFTARVQQLGQQAQQVVQHMLSGPYVIDEQAAAQGSATSLQYTVNSQSGRHTQHVVHFVDCYSESAYNMQCILWVVNVTKGTIQAKFLHCIYSGVALDTCDYVDDLLAACNMYMPCNRKGGYKYVQ